MPVIDLSPDNKPHINGLNVLSAMLFPREEDKELRGVYWNFHFLNMQLRDSKLEDVDAYLIPLNKLSMLIEVIYSKEKCKALREILKTVNMGLMSGTVVVNWLSHFGVDKNRASKTTAIGETWKKSGMSRNDVKHRLMQKFESVSHLWAGAILSLDDNRCKKTIFECILTNLFENLPAVLSISESIRKKIDGSYIPSNTKIEYRFFGKNPWTVDESLYPLKHVLIPLDPSLDEREKVKNFLKSFKPSKF